MLLPCNKYIHSRSVRITFAIALLLCMWKTDDGVSLSRVGVGIEVGIGVGVKVRVESESELSRVESEQSQRAYRIANKIREYIINTAHIIMIMIIIHIQHHDHHQWQ